MISALIQTIFVTCGIYGGAVCILAFIDLTKEVFKSDGSIDP